MAPNSTSRSATARLSEGMSGVCACARSTAACAVVRALLGESQQERRLDVCERADRAGALALERLPHQPLRAHEQPKPVVALRHVEVLGVALRRARRVLQPREALAREGVHKLRREVVAGPVREVVGQHRLALHRGEHGAVVGEQGLVVVAEEPGRDRHDGVGTRPRRRPRQPGGRRCRGPPDVRDHLDPPLRRLDRRRDDRGHLGLLEQGSLARGPGGHDPVHPVVHQQAEVQVQRVEIDPAVVSERRGQRRVHR